MCIAKIDILCEALREDSDSAQSHVWSRPRCRVLQFVIGSGTDTQKADLLAYIIRTIYNVEEENIRPIPISNVRLFALAFLFDWGCMIRGVSPVTSTQWGIGKTCAYPLGYYEYFEDMGLLKGSFERNVWCSNSRVLFNINFDTLQLRTAFCDGHVDALGSVLGLVTRIAQKYNVDFSASYLPEDGRITTADSSKNEFDSLERFRRIDADVVDYMLALDPFLDNFVVGKKFDIIEYTERYIQSPQCTGGEMHDVVYVQNEQSSTVMIEK